MLKRHFSILLALFTLLAMSNAHAHQPVNLLKTDTTAEKGPLLVDGTISFAVNASFTKASEVRGFRANLKSGEKLSVQYLILDKSPVNKLKNSQLPTVTITSPSGNKIEMKINERTKFFEPFSNTNYFFLSRYSATAESGTYSFLIRSKAKSEVTIAVGDREISGEVSRATTSQPTVNPSPSKTPAASATPSTSSSSATSSGYTMAKVRQNNSRSSCWSAINGKVYDLTKWINLHPGGQQRIVGICGVDGSASFNSQHRGQNDPADALKDYLLGPLE